VEEKLVVEKFKEKVRISNDTITRRKLEDN
jgi:hypothetical protein